MNYTEEDNGMYDVQEEAGYQVIVTNIKYSREIGNGKVKEKPDMTVLDIPEDILKQIDDDQRFKDSVESFVYKTITKKYGAEVHFAQIWLPDNK